MKIRFLIIIVIFIALYIYKSQFSVQKEEQIITLPNSDNLSQTELMFTDKTFSFKYDNSSLFVENISLFDASEEWIGSGLYDNKLFFEYPSSLTVAGSDKNKVTVQKKLKLDLSKTFGFELLVNLRTDPNDLETANIIFIDEDSKTAKYPLSIVRNGWEIAKFNRDQFVSSSSFNWGKIIGVKFELTPRPLGKVVANLAGFRVAENIDLSNDWNYVDKRFFVLDKRQNIISLLARNMGAQPAGVTIKKITSASDFSFQSAFSPLSETWTGLFFRGNYQNSYGYYLMVNGIGGSQWQIYKVDKEGLKVLKKEIIPDFQFKFGSWYFLKVEAKNDILKAYLSTDGKQFRLLGEVNDDEFKSGGVGLAVGNGAVSLYKDIVFTQ